MIIVCEMYVACVVLERIRVKHEIYDVLIVWSPHTVDFGVFDHAVMLLHNLQALRTFHSPANGYSGWGDEHQIACTTFGNQDSKSSL